MVGRQGVQGLGQRTRGGGNAFQLLRAQGVDVLVQGFARIDPVVDPVQAGHEQGGEGQVAVARGVGEADLHPFGLGRGRVHGDADGCRAVAGGVGQVDRGLVSGDQTAIGVGRRVGEGAEGLGVSQDAADEVEGLFREAAVAFAGEEGLPALPQGDVNVHA